MYFSLHFTRAPKGLVHCFLSNFQPQKLKIFNMCPPAMIKSHTEKGASLAPFRYGVIVNCQ